MMKEACNKVRALTMVRAPTSARGARRATSSAAICLPPTLLCQTLLEPALLARLQVEAVLLDVLADSFALDLPPETAQRLLEGLVLSHGDQDQDSFSSRH